MTKRNQLLSENKDIFGAIDRHYLKKSITGEYTLFLKDNDGDFFILIEDPKEEELIIQELLKCNIEIRDESVNQ